MFPLLFLTFLLLGSISTKPESSLGRCTDTYHSCKSDALDQGKCDLTWVKAECKITCGHCGDGDRKKRSISGSVRIQPPMQNVFPPRKDRRQRSVNGTDYMGE